MQSWFLKGFSPENSFKGHDTTDIIGCVWNTFYLTAIRCVGFRKSLEKDGIPTIFQMMNTLQAVPVWASYSSPPPPKLSKKKDLQLQHLRLIMYVPVFYVVTQFPLKILCVCWYKYCLHLCSCAIILLQSLVILFPRKVVVWIHIWSTVVIVRKSTLSNW